MAAPRVLTEKEELAVVQLYKQGSLTGELADGYGVHPDTIRNVVKRAGVALRKQGGVEGSVRKAKR